MKSCLSITLLIVWLSLIVSPESQAQIGYQMSDNGYQATNYQATNYQAANYQAANSGYGVGVADRDYHQVASDTPKGNIFRRISGQSPSGYSRDQVFAHNETLPLGGLFAPDFDLTASVFGGWNRIVGFDGLGDDYDDDFAVGIAYGRRHSKRLRSEFEFTYRSNDADTIGSVDVYSIMKNFLVDIELPNRFATPYVGIGIGYANVDTAFDRASGVSVENSGAFAFQPIAGVSVQLRERVSYYVEYRYFSTTDLDVSIFGTALDDVTYNAHNLFMGLRAEF